MQHFSMNQVHVAAGVGLQLHNNYSCGWGLHVLQKLVTFSEAAAEIPETLTYY